jgi:hypothetical protein
MFGRTYRGAFLALVALFVGLSGCASSGESAAPQGEPGTSTRITIDNLASNAEDLQIYIVQDGGVARTLVGSVPRGETRTLTYEGQTGGYRLIAVRSVGGETTSDRINVTHSQHFSWTIQGNRMLIQRR